MTSTLKSTNVLSGLVAAVVGLILMVSMVPAASAQGAGSVNVKAVGSGANGNYQGLAGVTFKLVKVDGYQEPPRDLRSNPGTEQVTNGDGIASFSGVAPGFYWAVPTKAPAGYSVPEVLTVGSFDSKFTKADGSPYGYFFEVKPGETKNIPEERTDYQPFWDDAAKEWKPGRVYENSSGFIPMVADNPELSAAACSPVLDVTLVADLSYSTAGEFNITKGEYSPTIQDILARYSAADIGRLAATVIPDLGVTAKDVAPGLIQAAFDLIESLDPGAVNNFPREIINGTGNYTAGVANFVQSLSEGAANGAGINLDFVTFGGYAGASDLDGAGTFDLSDKGKVEELKKMIGTKLLPAQISIKEGYNLAQFTNWEDALNHVKSSGPTGDGQATKLVVFLTDGMPTVDLKNMNTNEETSNPGWTSPSEVERAVAAANSLKQNGVRVVAAGVGASVTNEASAQNLKLISGPKANNDYYTTNWDQLGGVLSKAVQQAATDAGCTPKHQGKDPKLEIKKEINGDDANDAPGVEVEAGSDMKIDYIITNKGDGNAFDVKISDAVNEGADKDRIQSDIDAALKDKANIGNLAPGESKTVSITVKAASAKGDQHTNVATVTGTPGAPDDDNTPDPNKPGGLKDDDPANAHTPGDNPPPAPGEPGFDLTKTADPKAGTTVNAGDEITYTVTGTNTGDIELEVKITDDMSKVLDKADFVEGSLKSSVGDAPKLDGNTISWSGNLPKKGDKVVLNYTVKVKEGINGPILENMAKGSYNPPGEPPQDTPPVVVEHPTPRPEGLNITKFINGDDANSAPGVTVNPGDDMKIKYTVENMGSSKVFGIKIADKVTAGAEKDRIQKDIMSELDKIEAFDLASGESKDIEITVKAASADGDQHTNVAVANGVPEDPNNPGKPKGDPGDPDTPRVTSPEDPANAATPGFEVTKTADPVSGTEVSGGQTITYTVTGTNTGATRLKANIDDNLAEVLNNAAIVNPPAATIAGKDAGEAKVDGTTMNWNGFLEVGQKVEIKYTVKVNDGVSGILLHNVATGEATPVDPDGNPTGDPITPPPAETEHPVPGAPGYELTKTADPESGSNVDAGQTVTYTVTGKNTGGTNLETTIDDDLSKVLTYASYNNDARATIDGKDAGEVKFDGVNLHWAGQIGIGKQVEITYSVKVNDDVSDVSIHNLASSTAQPLDPNGNPIGDPINPPDVETVHYVPGKSPLANTGANVAAIGGVAALAILGGLGVAARRRRD